VSQLPGFPGLVLQLAGLTLKEIVALFEGGHARSSHLALAGQSDSANYRVYLRESEWHVRARNPGYSRDDSFYHEETVAVLGPVAGGSTDELTQICDVFPSVAGETAPFPTRG
jgi:hypothetical protein